MDYRELNRINWNKRAELHITSEFYAQPSFLKGRNSLPFLDQTLLKPHIHDTKALHLQCHFGQDTISLLRSGARETVGVDLSDTAIDIARKAAQELNANARFIQCDIYDTRQHLTEVFDLVYTSYGTIGWLPDIDKWAKVVSSSLAEGGTFVLVDFHPVIWMFDDEINTIKYSYFNTTSIQETEESSYTKQEQSLQSITWNHGLGEILNALLKNGMSIQSFEEYDYSSYDCFKNTVKIDDGMYRIKQHGSKLPMMYSIVAKKNKHE